MRPVIGITLDWQAEGTFSKRPHYALRQSYFDAVWAAGGLPVGIPLLKTAAYEEYLNHVSGLLIPGGDYPSPGWWYGDAHGTSDHPRAEADIAFIRKALEMDMPLLGICAGHQTLAVATGGRLVWKLKDSAPGIMNHRGNNSLEISHSVDIVPETLWHQVSGSTHFDVNSMHNEGVVFVGADVKVVGRAPDGVIEAIEIPGKRFALGAQWHVEADYGEDHANAHIMKAFIQAAHDEELRRRG